MYIYPNVYIIQMYIYYRCTMYHYSLSSLNICDTTIFKLQVKQNMLDKRHILCLFSLNSRQLHGVACRASETALEQYSHTLSN